MLLATFTQLRPCAPAGSEHAVDPNGFAAAGPAPVVSSTATVMAAISVRATQRALRVSVRSSDLVIILLRTWTVTTGNRFQPSMSFVYSIATRCPVQTPHCNRERP